MNKQFIKISKKKKIELIENIVKGQDRLGIENTKSQQA